MDIRDIRVLNESARKVHGADISIQVARAVAWGNDDTCILVHGSKHSEAAQDIARAAVSAGMKPKLSQDRSGGFMGAPIRAYSLVTFA